MDLIIFHYHFLTGGVTSVVTQAIKAFRMYLPDIKKISLVTGGEILKPIQDIDLHIMPEIAYLDYEKIRKSDFKHESQKLAELLLKNFGSQDSVWWIHNYHLGKNPIFTEALLMINKNKSTQRMILHIHDFPECGRFKNLHFLNKILSVPAYPINPAIHYVVLNTRDMNILTAAGIPSSLVNLLENPVEPYQLKEKSSFVLRDKQSLKKKLFHTFSGDFPSFNPDAPLLLYPVRAIRRKNVLESALLAALIGQSANLVVSLPGISKPENKYSRLIEQGYRQSLIKGLWAVGTHTSIQFEETVEASDLIISSSIQEGFGYLFINALQWRRPLAARDLDTLSGMKDMFRNYPAVFYNKIQVPLKRIMREKLEKSYNKKMKSLSHIIPDILLVEEELMDLLKMDTIDFPYLTMELQYQILEELKSAKLSDELRLINRDLLNDVAGLINTSVPDRSQEVEKRFGLKQYADSFAAILHSLGKPLAEKNRNPKNIHREIIHQFTRKEYFRLLYD